MRLTYLYHWSPRDRRHSIRKEGLIPGSIPNDGPGPIPHICLGTDPRSAWNLSGDTDWGSEKENWDLWLVVMEDRDDIRIRADWGPYIMEVKVYNVIPANRLWWVGERQPWMTFGEGDV